MPSRNAATEITRDYFTEEELDVISEALKELIDNRADSSGESCLDCDSSGSDDEGNPDHEPGCRVRLAGELLGKLGHEVPSA